MTSHGSPLFKVGLLFGLLVGTHAVPSVNVALRASFGAPPYLVELLETAAEENATAYFPLLDRIADGHFDSFRTDRELYDGFRTVLQQDGHLSQLEDLSSFDLALSLHSAAPRIEAHYQFYNTSIHPKIGREEGDECDTWVHVPFSGQRFCSPDLAESHAKAFGEASETEHQLPFDRILGVADGGRPSVLYADITSEAFRKFHKTVSKTAHGGKTSYRVRYKPARLSTDAPLSVSGYGVELALKRTDYIVIDDRQADEEKENKVPAAEATLSEEEVSDLRPLSSSELLRLGHKAAGFVMASDDPLGTLARLLQDFPKHSGSIAATNVSADFVHEHVKNRELLLTPGFTVMWINGVQIMARDFDAYALLEHLRRERKMINEVRELGLSAPEAIDLLSHEAISTSQLSKDTQRYDWRDDTEGGNVIIWLNDLEKDKRYSEWPNTISSVLQRTFPGQLPYVRRDMHNLIMPVDFSDYADVTMVVENLQEFVKRQIPIRFGLVPHFSSPAGAEQATTVYYLLDRYGLGAALDYLQKSVVGAGRKFGPPQQKYLQQAVEGRKLRRNRTVLPLQEVASDNELGLRVQGAKAYMARLAGKTVSPPFLVNGVPMPKSDDWRQAMSQRVGLDLRLIQQAVYEGSVTEEDYLPDLFLAESSLRRNPVIVPEDDKEIRHVDLSSLPQLSELPTLPASSETIERELAHLTIVADFDSEDGFQQLMEAILFQRQHDNVELAILHLPTSSNPARTNGPSKEAMEAWLNTYDAKTNEISQSTDETHTLDVDELAQRRSIYAAMFAEISASITPADDEHIHSSSAAFQNIVSACDVQSGQKALILNGRIVGPTSADTEISIDDLDTLLTYERKKRLLPAALAMESLELGGKFSSPLSFARISNLIALSQVSDVPEGIFEAAPTVRTAVFKQWNSTYTAIKNGNVETASIQIHAVIDPASEVAQRWVPIIRALADLDGVYLCVFLNPKDRLEELPVKRFYRYVLNAKPAFAADGSSQGLSARFNGLPADALLNMGMDLPPSWLVAPQDSVHDLDNIKLSAVKGELDIEAIYELEHILIEGHSRDVTLGPPPRGAQLVLGTQSNPHVADTIIMANLGYFQFKANPGIYNLAMQEGRSEEIFNIDSAGTLGYSIQPGDSGTEIALMSFRGSTLFPRVSRKPGTEEEDVLQASKSALENLADGADKLLAQAGLAGTETGKYLSQAAKFGSSFFSHAGKSVDVSDARHADINIFSVASGHLYERMLNIMMVSVMRHTTHTVKFWFIEQFLSPSFKSFLPVLAAEYGFRYEMVTYKWPHWLRGQKEKQREIWGYKILFLDVLFPLDLEKVIFVDADQIVRTDMYELVQHDLKGAPYGFTPMCDSRTEMEGFRFWKQGYWKDFLRGLPYHISALYVVDLKKFRQIAAGDRLRQHYHQLSADPASLSNLDQDLPNHMQMLLPIHSLPQEWLWCETWCSDEALKEAKTIDLCNNPQTKEPKLDRARRQVPEWTVYDDEIATLAKRHQASEVGGQAAAGDAHDAGLPGDGESIQEQLQREDAEEARKKAARGRDEL